MPALLPTDQDYVHALSALTLGRSGFNQVDPLWFVGWLTPAQREQLAAMAEAHHVVVRALTVLEQDAAVAGNTALVAWAGEAIARERARIDRALPFLDEICRELAAAGCPVTVIKSLDHWPDLGSDLDLYATADEPSVVRAMVTRFKAAVEPRSWGDRLAQKWNFKVPGLAESVEIHCQRLGQTGEHIALARRFVTRRVYRALDGHNFPVPAPEERVIVATLQRMYRHFYFRLSDMLNTAALLDAHALDFGELRAAAELGGIWPGVATYLKLVSDYVRQFRGQAPPMPAEVAQAALFSGRELFVRNRFIRLPMIPHGARLYTRQITRSALRGDVPATFRLTLLPPLASVAAVAYKLTGSDKGIW